MSFFSFDLDTFACGFIFCMLSDVVLSLCSFLVERAHYYRRQKRYIQFLNEKYVK